MLIDKVVYWTERERVKQSERNEWKIYYIACRRYCYILFEIELTKQHSSFWIAQDERKV